MELWFWWLMIWGIAIWVGTMRGQTVSGVVWGFLLGPFGILIVCLLPNRVKEEQLAKKKVLASYKDSERTALLERTLATQEEQLKVLRALLAHEKTQQEPDVVEISSASNLPTTAPLKEPPAQQIEDFVPESLKALKKPRRNYPI